MSSELRGMLIGGALPALLYGVTGVLQKMSANAKGGSGMYLIFLGVGTVIVGVVFHVMLPEPPITVRPLTSNPSSDLGGFSSPRIRAAASSTASTILL